MPFDDCLAVSFPLSGSGAEVGAETAIVVAVSSATASIIAITHVRKLCKNKNPLPEIPIGVWHLRASADYVYVAALLNIKQICSSLSFRNFQYVFISILILFPRLVREWGTRGAHARNAIIIVLVLRCIMHIYYIDSRMSMNSWRVIPRSRMALRTTNSGIGSTCV